MVSWSNVTTSEGANFFVFFIRKSKPNETNFFCIFERKKQANKAKEPKQNKNKVKRVVVRDSPCKVVLNSPAMVLEKVLMG